MNCLKFSDLIAYQLQQLDLKKNQSVEHHLKICPKCRKKIDDYKRLQTFLKMKSIHKPVKKTEACFDDFNLVDYLETKGNKRMRSRYYTHLSQCAYCLDRLIALENILNDLKDEGLIPTQKDLGEKIGELLVTGKKKITNKWIGFWERFVSPNPVYRWAGIVLIVLVTSLTVFQLLKENKAPLTTRESTFENEIRLRTPENKSIVENLSQLIFAWSGIEKATSYNFILLDTHGNIIWEEKTNQTELRLPDDIHLQSSMTYFWKVEAFLDYGISIQSEMVNFIYNHH